MLVGVGGGVGVRGKGRDEWVDAGREGLRDGEGGSFLRVWQWVRYVASLANVKGQKR